MENVSFSIATLCLMVACAIASTARVDGAEGANTAEPHAVVPPVTKFAAEFFVAPNGNDRNAGARATPVAGLTRARDLVRGLRARGEHRAIAVNVQPGEYPLTAALQLSAEDSGTETGPVVYRAVQPGKSVFYGGRRLTGFQTVTNAGILARLPEESRGKVWQCDLRALGIDDYGRIAPRGFGMPPPPPTVEVFVNGKPMTLARWPNTGFTGMGSVVASGDKKAGKPAIFRYGDSGGNRQARWTQATDVWLFGYFRFDWADGSMAVTRIDPQNRTMVCNEPYEYKAGEEGAGVRQGRYYAFNLLEELDQPGEWYLDRAAGVFYLYPPADLATATVELGMLSAPMVTMTNVTNIRIEGLTFDLGRCDGLVLTNCSRVLIAGCTVSRLARNGILIHGGEGNGVLSCDIRTIGCRATEVIGGDREILKPGRHFVENCRIHDFGRLSRTYTPAIQLEGVGNRAAHNEMFDCPSSVMRVEGNDHVIEYNEVHNALQESDDQGAVDMWGNFTYRGIVFRHNRFTDCRKPGAVGDGQAAIRLDDTISGVLVYGNIFIRSGLGNKGAVHMRHGRDNVIENNLFIECDMGVTGGWDGGNKIWQLFIKKGDLTPYGSMFFTNALYLSRYPAMAGMATTPGSNVVRRNVFYRCRRARAASPTSAVWRFPSRPL